jgi:hypothetical protein
MSKLEWCKNNTATIEAALELDAQRWVESLGYELASDGLIIDGQRQKLLGRDKGKVAYIGSHLTNKDGYPYLSLTIVNHAHGGSKESYQGSYDVVTGLWDEYRSGDNTSLKRADEYRKANAAKQKEREAKAKTEAEKKAAYIKQDIAKYGGLSNDAHKYKKGVDNGGVLSGVKAAMDVGGDEAVDKLLQSGQEPPENWDEFRLNYLGLKSFWKEVDQVIRRNQRAPLEAALEFAKPHLDRLGLDSKAIEAKVNEAGAKSTGCNFSAYLKRAVDSYKSRLIKADKEVCIERDLKGVPCPETGTLVIDSPMGSGKSAWLKTNVFERLQSTALSLLPRVALHHDQCRRFGTASYETLKDMAKNGDWSKLYELDTRQLTCVYNSLPFTLKLLKKKEENETVREHTCKPRLFKWRHDKIDVLVLDEIELGLMHCFFGKFDSEALRRETIRELMLLVRNAKLIVGTQAGITEFTRAFLKACGREDIYIIRNIHQRYEGKVQVNVYDHKNDVIMKLLERVEAGHPAAIACSTKKMTQGLIAALKAKYPHLKVDGIHSGNTGDHLKILLDPSKNTIGLDVFIYSPSIEQGVSIENGRFKYVYGLYEGGDKTVSPSGFAQMLFRSRDVENIDLWCNPQTDDKPTDYMKILDREAKNFEITKHDLKKNSDGMYKVNVEKEYLVTEFDVLRAKAQATLNAERNDPKATILGALAYMGCKVNHAKSPDIDDAPVKALLRVGKQLQAQEYEAGTNAAPKITQDEYDQLKSKNATTTEDAHKKSRFIMESVFKCDLDALSDADKTQAHADWKQGKALKTIEKREVMALPRNQALALAGRDLEYGRGSRTWLMWKLFNWIFEVLGFSFSKDRMLKCDGHWVTYDDLRGHRTYEWVKANRDSVNSLDLVKIRGNELTDREIRDMILATELPVKFERVDQDTLRESVTEVSNCDYGAVSQSRGTDIYIKSKSSTLKNGTPQKRDRVRLLTIDQSTTITQPKPTDSVARRVFDGIMAILAALVGARLLDDGRIECRPDAMFRLEDLRQGDWYEWALANKALINKAKLGAQIKGDAPSDEALRRWLRKFGFKLVSTRKDIGHPKTDLTEIVCGFIEKESDFLRGAMSRRLRAGTPLSETAQKWLDKKAQEIAEYGAPLIPDRPVTPTTARLTIRHGIRWSLHITADEAGGLKCEPPRLRRGDFVFRYEDLMREPWYDFACKHKDVVNKAGLGAQFTGDAPSRQVLTAWLKAMGIEVSSKKIEACKLLINKGGKK